jgi:hypothetical protein
MPLHSRRAAQQCVQADERRRVEALRATTRKVRSQLNAMFGGLLTQSSGA